MAKGPYNELGSMLKRAAEKRKRQQKLANAQKKLKDRTPGYMSAINEMGYIRENGLDREDARKRNTDRRAFQADVNGMIKKNEMDAMKKGKAYYDYSISRATKRGQKK